MDIQPDYYNEEAVRRVLNWPLVNDAVETALKAAADSYQFENKLSMEDECARVNQIISQGGAYVNQPKRNMTMACNNPSKVLLTMPAFVGNYNSALAYDSGDGSKQQSLACKLVTSFRGNSTMDSPLPNVMAHIALFNSENGRLEAIMAGTDITTWRTVSASLIATKYLYFRRYGLNAEQERQISVGIIGCGTQGRMHALAMCVNFCVKTIYLWNRTKLKAQQLAEEMLLIRGIASKTTVVVANTAAEAVEDVDVVCIATYSRDTLISAQNLRKQRSMHINAVGAGEVHFGELANDIYAEAKTYVDCYANAAAELIGLPGPIAGEVGGVIKNANYPDIEALTIFQSMGMAAEDACVAQAVREALLY